MMNSIVVVVVMKATTTMTMKLLKTLFQRRSVSFYRLMLKFHFPSLYYTSQNEINPNVT